MSSHLAKFKHWVKPFLFSVILVILCLYLLEGFCSSLYVLGGYLHYRKRLARAEETHDVFHCQYDSELGWVHVPNKRLPDLYGKERSLTINAQGFRGKEDLLLDDKADRFRLVCLGDSFTMGYGVDDIETYPAQLSRLNPRVKAMNMGQGGYSLGQCYLWYQRCGEMLDAHALVFAFVIADIARLEGGYLKNGYAKPGFDVRDGKLVVTHQPVPQKIPTGEPLMEKDQLTAILSKHSSLVRLMFSVKGRTLTNTSGNDVQEPIVTAIQIFREMNASLREKGIPLVLVLLPEMRHLGIPQNRPQHIAVSRYIRDFSIQEEIPYLDLLDNFDRSAKDLGVFYLEDQQYHYSPEGNALVARHVNAFLQETIPNYPR